MWPPNHAFAGTPAPSNFTSPWSELRPFSSNIFNFYHYNALYILHHYYPKVHIPFRFFSAMLFVGTHVCHDRNTCIRILANQNWASHISCTWLVKRGEFHEIASKNSKRRIFILMRLLWSLPYTMISQLSAHRQRDHEDVVSVAISSDVTHRNMFFSP